MPKILVVREMQFLLTGDVFGFPNGRAATRYIRLVARGLLSSGCHVRVIVPNYTEYGAAPENTEAAGVSEGIPFEYATGSPIGPRGRIGWKLGQLRARLLISLRLWSLRARRGAGAVVLYGRSHKWLVYYSRWCRRLDLPLIVYVVEWLLDVPGQSKDKLEKAAAFYQDLCLHADGIVVISEFLEHKFEELARSRGIGCPPILRTSILCDPAEWRGIRPASRERPYLIYCADLDGYLHDLTFVFHAFAELAMETHDLVAVGSASPETRRAIAEQLEQLDLGDRVELRAEFVPQDELYGLYAGASALLAPLHADTRSLGRFPSKIADYMLSGRPVVSSAVGEVAQYLTDGETAFLAPPGSTEAFTAKIREALTSGHGDAVGARGKQLAASTFHYAARARALTEFVTRTRSGK
jgi:glycosyltransferase involved in cell wall biosynthesis